VFSVHDEPNLCAGVYDKYRSFDGELLQFRRAGVQSGVCAAVCVFISVAEGVMFETMYICRLCDSVCAQVKFTCNMTQ